MNKNENEIKIKEKNHWFNLHIINHRFIVGFILVIFYLIKNYLFKDYAVNILLKDYATAFWIDFITLTIIIIIISLINNKKVYLTMLYLFSILTTILYVGNLIYAKNFGDMLSSLLLFQANQLGDVSNSIFNGLKIEYTLFLLDIVFIYLLNKKLDLSKKISDKRKIVLIPLLLVIITSNLYINALSFNINARSWNAKSAMQMGLLSYHLAELPASFYKVNFPKEIDEQDIEIFKGKLNNKVVDNELNGILEDKNIVFIQWETLSKYGLLMNIDGEDVMPNLKNIYNQSYVNERFLNTVAGGHSSDTEFLTLQSMYNYNDKSVSVMDADKSLKTFINLLNEEDYYTFSMHNFNGGFWNRTNMHNNFGFNESIFLADTLEDREDDRLLWGFSDSILYEEAHKKMNDVYETEGKFMSYLITVQNHTPFEILEPEKFNVPYESNLPDRDANTNNYFTSLKETDSYFGEFMNSIKDEEWFDNTVFVIYADHDLELKSNKLAKFLNQESMEYHEQIYHEQTPFMIYSPTIDLSQYNKEFSYKDMNHKDIVPTLSQLMNFDTTNYPFYGQNIFDREQDTFTLHVQGVLLHDDYIYNVNDYPNAKLYKKTHRETGEESDLTEEEIQFIDEKMKELISSQKIINKNELQNLLEPTVQMKIESLLEIKHGS